MSDVERQGPGNTALDAELRALASELGFDRFGVARADALDEEGALLRSWLDAGRHGQMDYMARTADVRCDPRHEGMLAGALSVVVLARAYQRTDQQPLPDGVRIARYARGRDYHNVLHKKLRKLTALLREHGHEARAAVDSMPVFERAWAARAGIGFIGKNACLIVPGLGSHLFLSAVVTSAALPTGAPMTPRCGSCRRCLDACPTDAFVAERSLDARRCISYLTIEHRGAVEPALRQPMGPWLFGCDACQDVCPFNATSPPEPERTTPFAPDARRAQLPTERWLQLDEEQFAELCQGSPFKRTGREGMARNAAITLANTGQRRSLVVLQEAAREDASPVVREAAAWAVAQLEAKTPRQD